MKSSQAGLNHLAWAQPHTRDKEKLHTVSFLGKMHLIKFKWSSKTRYAKTFNNIISRETAIQSYTLLLPFKSIPSNYFFHFR